MTLMTQINKPVRYGIAIQTVINLHPSAIICVNLRPKKWQDSLRKWDYYLSITGVILPFSINADSVFRSREFLKKTEELKDEAGNSFLIKTQIFSVYGLKISML